MGIIKSTADFAAALNECETMGVTGFENGLAISHGKSSTVTRAAFAVVRLIKPLTADEYHSLDPKNCVDTLFVLAIPGKQVGSTHLTLLAELLGRFGDESFLKKIKSSKTIDELLDLLTIVSETETEPNGLHKGLILGITACAAGIAHTYIAAEAINKKVNELGYESKVEKQGSNGIENCITQNDINQAVGIILAHDVALKELNRFSKLPKIDVKVSKPIKNPEKVINNLLDKSRDYVPTYNESIVEKTEKNQLARKLKIQF